MSIFSNGQNGSSDTINPVESGKIVIETVTAINAGGRIGVHQTSCTSDGGIKIDIWYAVATIFAEEWITSLLVCFSELIRRHNQTTIGGGRSAFRILAIDTQAGAI